MKNGFWVEKALEIWKVSKHKDVDVGVGYDMYRTDVMFGDNHTFNTGDTFPEDYDWAGLQAKWDALSLDEQKEASVTWHEFVKLYYELLCKAWVDEDPEKFASYIVDYLAD